MVSGEYFADRERERRLLRNALTEPQAHLVVFGPRRMGKTSTLEVVRAELEAEGKPVILADLSTASAVTDMTQRLLQAAGVALGRRWTDLVSDLARRLTFRFTVQADPGTGHPVFGLEPAGREAPLDDQRRTLGEVLDAIDAMAGARRVQVGVILDEFQEIHRFGGAAAEAHLRGHIQRHRHVSYVLAGSDARLIAAMQGRGRAFYGLLEPLPLGPIEPEMFARWLEWRMRSRGVDSAPGLGAVLVAAAGPRTRDVVRLARETFAQAVAARRADRSAVEAAYLQIIANEEAAHRALWASCSPLQQNVLRAVGAAAGGLTTQAVRGRFGLGASGSATRAAQALVARELLVAEGRGTYLFDSPFFRAWVVATVLADVGATAPLLPP